jgi:hypothetical protein
MSNLVVRGGYEAYEDLIERAYKKLDPIERVSRHGSPIRKVRLAAEDVADHPSIPDDIILFIAVFEAELGQRNPDAEPHYMLKDIILRRHSDRNYIVVPEPGETKKQARAKIKSVGDVRKAKRKAPAKKAAPKKVEESTSPVEDEFAD